MNGDIERVRQALHFIPVGGHDERVRVSGMGDQVSPVACRAAE